MKMPLVIATTSLAIASAFGVTSTAIAVEPDIFMGSAKPYIRSLDIDHSSTTVSDFSPMPQTDEAPVVNIQSLALSLFGEMRNSTEEEKKLYEDMLARISTPIDLDIFAI